MPISDCDRACKIKNCSRVGFSGGAFALLAPLYSSETSETSISGATTSMTQLMVTLGVGFVAALNIKGAVHWVYITSICSIIPSMFDFI